MSRELEYDPNLKCDICGKLGSFDFIGDYICQKCLEIDKGGRKIKKKKEDQLNCVTDECLNNDNITTIQSFIKELQSIKESLKTIPLVIECPNGLLTRPLIKMIYNNDGHPILGDKVTKIIITW